MIRSADWRYQRTTQQYGQQKDRDRSSQGYFDVGVVFFWHATSCFRLVAGVQVYLFMIITINNDIDSGRGCQSN